MLKSKLYLLKPYRFTIVDGYIIKDFLKTAIGAMVLFITIYLFSLLVNDLPYFINRMAHDDTTITMDKILSMYFNQIPHKALWVSPLAFLFSTMYTIGNFNKNNEAVAYIGAGVHLIRVNFFILLISLLYSLFLIPFTDLVVVPTFDRAETLSLEMRHKRQKDMTKDLETYGRNNIYYFIERFDRKKGVMSYPIIARERLLPDDQVLDYDSKAFFEKTENETKVISLAENKKKDQPPVKKEPGKINSPKTNKHAMKKNAGNIREKQRADRKKLRQRKLQNKAGKTNKARREEFKRAEFPDSDKLYSEIKDDFPITDLRAPKTPLIKRENKNKDREKYFKRLEAPVIMATPKEAEKEDNEFYDLEKLYLKDKDSGKAVREEGINALVDKSMRMVNRERFSENGKKTNQQSLKRRKNNQKTIGSNYRNKKAFSDPLEKELYPEGPGKIGLAKDFDDARNLSGSPPNRDEPVEVIRVPRNLSPYVVKDLDVKKKEQEKPVVRKKRRRIKSPVNLSWRGLEEVDELSLLREEDLMDNDLFQNLVKEQELINRKITRAEFKVNPKDYLRVPFPSYFSYRIDARRAVWDNSKGNWVAYDGEIRVWHKDKGLIK
ncbi:MAG: LptF/LptG family permease, partial [Spirochaetota bacterium]|nr:LptF/LptG family permease [Spirochaetota bacterium]